MALNRFHVVSPLALVAFSACRSPYIQGGAVNGAVVNGPLNSALVFLDYDFDGILDANEPNARTNEFGEYDLTATRDFYDLVAIADDQTVDTSSGATFPGITLKPQWGAGVLSPTSTYVPLLLSCAFLPIIFVFTQTFTFTRSDPVSCQQNPIIFSSHLPCRTFTRVLPSP